MAAQVQTLYNDSSLLYDELHKLYPEVAESDIVTLMRENGYDRVKCLAALVHKSNQALYGPEPVAMTTAIDQFADLHLPPPATRHQFSDTTSHQISVPQLTPTSRDMPYFTAQQTHYVQRPPAVSVSQKPQFSPCFPPPEPHEQTSSGQVPRYVTQIDVEAQNCDRVVGQGGGYMSPSYNPSSSLPHFAGLPGTCAIERQPASLQIHSNNTPAAEMHHGILVERPGQFSQPFPQGSVPHRGGGDHHRQLYTPPPGVESYPTSQQRFVRQSPSALQHPSPLSQTPPTPSSSRYLTTTFIKVSPGEHSRVPFYQPTHGPLVATPPTYPWQSPSYNRSSPTDLLTSPDPDIARIRQQPLQPLVSPARPSLLQPEGIGPVPWLRSEVPASEDAYMQTLLQYQAQRRHKLEQDMVESRRLLEQLRAEVTSMEQEQLTRRRRSRNYTFPQTHHVQSIRETNRKLQIDIKIMAAQVDMVTNGQTPLGILDPQEQQRFYSNINPGQQVPINQSVSPHLHPATPHSLHSVSPPPPYVPSHVNPMPPHGPPDDVAQWSCSACTFLNHPQLDKCEVCEMPRVSVGFT